MGLTFPTGVVAGTPIGPFGYNDFQALLTGSMTDQPITLKYAPAAGTTPLLTLISKAGNPLIKGFKPDGTTQAFLMDENGNLTVASINTGGGSLTVSGITDTGSLTVSGTFTSNNGGATFNGGPVSFNPSTAANQYDMLHLLSRDTTYTAYIGYTDAAATTGAGLYAYDTKTPGYIFFNGTNAGIKFPNNVQAGNITNLGNETIGGTLAVTGKITANGSVAVPGGTITGYGAASIKLGDGTYSDVRIKIGSNNLFYLDTDEGVNPIVTNFRIDNAGNVTTAGVVHVGGGTYAPNYIQSSLGWFGVKGSGGAKLFEGRSDGTFVIGGGTYYTGVATYNYSANGTFDGFDTAECYELDATYPTGTIVCPGPNGKLTRCTHDKCPAAMVVSSVPGFCMGTPDEENGVQPVALAGRVNAVSYSAIASGSIVCSDGKGGVRAMSHGEAGTALGFALNDATDGVVGVFLRPGYCVA